MPPKTLVLICNRVIEYSFYVLLFFVPLAFISTTSELFEFNKLWVTFGFTIVIALFWMTKMIALKNFRVQRTLLDIPILLFLLALIIATFHSLDPHISIWGYYSRFNGGLLSMISYVFLYYAFLSNVKLKSKKEEHIPQGKYEQAKLNPQDENSSIEGLTMVKRLIWVSLSSCLLVALWGFPSHFGYDPTCLLFRGTFDVSCWTDAFQPKIRIFSTMGQPDWLAAYLLVLLPITIILVIKHFIPETIKSSQDQKSNLSPRGEAGKNQNYNSKVKSQSFLDKKSLLFATSFLLLSILFYLDLTWTDSRSGYLAFWASFAFLLILVIGILVKHRILQKSVFYILILITSLFLVATFFGGTPIGQLRQFTFQELKGKLFQPPSQPTSKTTNISPTQQEKPALAGELGGTDSVKLRFLVWSGALNIWKDNPLFGTGLETFAFAYYKYRPAEHNLTSEWDFLYNKAHNEYLNYLATTGLFGLGTYLLTISLFLFLALKNLLFKKIPIDKALLAIGFLSAYTGILITNFFGFSVVIINVYFFLIPACVFILMDILDPHLAFSFGKKEKSLQPQDKKLGKKIQFGPKKLSSVTPFQWTFIAILFLIAIFYEFALFTYWQADIEYALGYNLARANAYDQAYPHAKQAIILRDNEPVFQDELAFDAAVMSSVANQQKDSAKAQSYAQEAISLSNKVITEHPQNIVFWKTRVRVFYTLAQIDSRYLLLALEAVEKAHKLAPTDARIGYNLAVLYGQTNQSEKAVKTLEKVTKEKPDYRDAFYAKGLFYRDLALDKNGKVINQDYEKRAVEAMRYILTHINPLDQQTIDTLTSWGEK